MKKIILTMGSLAMAATATVGTVLTVASCGSSSDDNSADATFDDKTKQLSLNISTTGWPSLLVDSVDAENQTKVDALTPNVTSELKEGTFNAATSFQVFKQDTDMPWLNYPVTMTMLKSALIAPKILDFLYSADDFTKLTKAINASKNLGDLEKAFDDVTFVNNPVNKQMPDEAIKAMTADKIAPLAATIVGYTATWVNPGFEFHNVVGDDKIVHTYISDNSMTKSDTEAASLNTLWDTFGKSVATQIAPDPALKGITFSRAKPKSLGDLATLLNAIVTPKATTGTPAAIPANKQGTLNDIAASLNTAIAGTTGATPTYVITKGDNVTADQMTLFGKLTDTLAKTGYLLYVAQMKAA
ncbi:MAG: hypothetical protein NC236_01055 [Mycoplasma sp.]|nr:hypothetical protein [Mycoplasma sp.]